MSFIIKQLGSRHSFHIPVMGTGFTIDTPVKVAKYGIHSVVSLVDDELIELMRRHYSQQAGVEYVPIDARKEKDARALRITSYFNLLNSIVNKEFEVLRSGSFDDPKAEIHTYFQLLPETSILKQRYLELSQLSGKERSTQEAFLKQEMRVGEIQANIMTKLNHAHYDSASGEQLPDEFSDALSALRGFALSDVDSSIEFSAGLNMRLYGYIEKFNDFLLDSSGKAKKRIIIKVSDYRSALTQGKILAKKGLWVHEFRIESGLNCGGHAFATDGILAGPVLDEFREKKEELTQTLASFMRKSSHPVPEQLPEINITYQGGVGTAQEHNFLLEYYKLSSIGWGSPFLLVPEVTNVDEHTLQKLAAAGESDVYLSDVSPLGVPFNNLKDSASDVEKMRRAEEYKPGSTCPRKYLSANTEFTSKPICVASRAYQNLKLTELEKPGKDSTVYQSIVNKACICHDLGVGAILKHNLQEKGAQLFSAICPGPNIAYFSKILTLRQMIDHVYDRANFLNDLQRPHVFLKEFKLYLDYFHQRMAQKSNLEDCVTFLKNLSDGVEYYKRTAKEIVQEEMLPHFLEHLNALQETLQEYSRPYTQTTVPA